MSFESELAAFHKKVRENHIKIKRMSAFDLMSSIIIETPVLDGVLRNNWYAQMNTYNNSVTDEAATSNQTVINRVEGILVDTKEEVDITFSNNLPYAEPIEFDGLSGKAPEGMVRVNTIRWDSIVAVNARKVNK